MNGSTRAFFVFAICFGLISFGVGTMYLLSGEIAVHEGRRPRQPLAEEQALVGRIGRDDLAFYPIAIGWAAVGIATIVASVGAWCTGSSFFARAAGVGCVGVLLMGAATVGAAYWYGEGEPPANPPVPAAIDEAN